MNDETLLRLIREGLDGRAAALDPRSLNRLRQARRQALAGLPAAGWRRWWQPGWAPLTLAAVASLLLAALLLAPLAPGPGNDGILTDAEILAYDEGLDLYDELEFYQWLEEEPLAPNG